MLKEKEKYLKTKHKPTGILLNVIAMTFFKFKL
jgi:hypothetical protein